MRLSRRRVSAANIVVALALIASIGVIIWVWSVVRTEPTPPGPIPIATDTPIDTAVDTAVGTAVDTAVATAISSPSPQPRILLPSLPLITVERIDRGTLPELLRYSPDRLGDDSLPLSDVAQYANINAWMRARNIDTPDGPDDPMFDAWEAELENLAIPNVLATRGNETIWIDTYGFGLVDVDQVLAVGQAPDFVLIMRGDFNADELQAAWAESGYQAIRSQDLTLWSLYPGDAVDLSAPASRPALGNMNNIVLLEDGTLIATSRLARLEQAIRAVRNEEASLDENPAVTSVLSPGTLPNRMDTAVILKGSFLTADPGVPVAVATPERKSWAGRATPIAERVVQEPALPQAMLMLAGLDAPVGPDGSGRLTMVFSYDTADDAVGAAIRAERVFRMSDSPVTGEPYRDRIDVRAIRTYATGGDGFVMEILASLPGGSSDWLAMIEDRDLGFVMWPWEP